MTVAISIENLSKAYHLGQIGTGTFTNDLKLWWARTRGKPNPLLRVGEANRGNRDGETIWALKDVSFTVDQGEVLGIIGRNGAGKSTLLKILSRVTAPTSGKIRAKGRIASLLEIGTGFHPELTGRENIYLNGSILGMSRQEIDRKFDEIVDFSGVEKFIETPVKRYSSGMYVRLAFAVAAHLEPEILVVDEVLAVGDAEFQKKCLSKMGEVAHEGRTVLFVSHNLVAVQELCERCVWLHAGQERAIGAAVDVINDYSGNNLYQAQNTGFQKKSYRGDGSIELISYDVLNAANEAFPLPTTNQDLIFRIKIISTRAIPRPACGISIRNNFGVLLTSINTVEQGKSFPSIPEGESEIVIKLAKVSYLPGDYLASFWIMNPNGHIYVLGEDVMSFKLEQTPIYGTRHVDHRWGCVFTDVDFSIGN
jgi:lipopolysaccharide transport system ATP-binding protein